MDFTGLIGFLAGLLLVGFGITTQYTDIGALKHFIDYSSMAITFGGTICATLIAFPLSYFKKIPSQLKIAMSRNRYDPKKYIATIVDFAQEARKKGLLSLEDKANDLKDPFLRDSILLIVDAIEPGKVREMLDNELDNLEERHAAGWGFYEKSSTFAPAFGMIGTLIGLINMLANLDMSSTKGTTALAQGMSMALVTTFYGSLLANLLLVPLGNRLHVLHDEEMLCKQIASEGVIAIQAGENPKHIEERLNAYLNQRQRGGDKTGDNKEAEHDSNK